MLESKCLTDLELCKLLCVELCHLLAEGDCADDLLHLRLVDDGGEPAVDVAERLPENVTDSNYFDEKSARKD